MSTNAIIMMVLVQLTVTIITLYFFFKVLKSPKKSEPDSFMENDDEEVK